jgi:hypothetical protein
MLNATKQPTNLNYLSQLNFKFVINKLPNVNFMIQAVNLPSVQMGVYEQMNPFIKIPRQGDHINYGPFSIVFKIDELMLNYIEIYDWFTAMGFPDSFNQAKQIYSSNSFEQTLKENNGKGSYSDATLTILNSSLNSAVSVNFYDLFPIGLSELTFDTRNQNINYIEATCTFAFRKFDVTPVGNIQRF